MLGTTADVVTLFAFAVTVFTAIKVFFINRDVQKLSNRYLLKHRLPEQLDNLRGVANELISHSYVTENNAAEIRHLVARIHAICDNLANKVQGQDNIQLLALNKVIRACREIEDSRCFPGAVRVSLDVPMLSSDDLSRLHGLLVFLIESITETIKDMEKVVA